MFSYKFTCDSNTVLALQLLIPLAILKSIIQVGYDKGISVADLKVKWPNDVYLQGRKLAGILVNSKSFGKKFVMNIGVGINVENVGENISLEEAYKGVFDRKSILEKYFVEFDSLINLLKLPGWEYRIVQEYKEN